MTSTPEQVTRPDELRADASGPSLVARPPMLRRLWKSSRHLLPVVSLLTLIFIVFSVTNEYFLTAANMKILMTSSTALWVVALGMTFAMISGAVDLSIGALIALLAIMFATLINMGLPSVLAFVVTIMAGALIGGLVNGVLIGRLQLSFLLVTMATLTAFTGFVNIWSDTRSIPVTSTVTDVIAFGDIMGINASIFIMIVTFAVALFVQSRTFFGRDVYAVGGNPVAARLAGINATRTTIAVFAIVGMAAAVAAVVGIGRSAAASPTVDNLLPLQAIACVLLGGTAMTGGSGGVGGTVLGVLFLATLGNGLSLSGISSYWQGVVTGVILVGAVLLNRLSGGTMTRRPLRRFHGSLARRPAA